ncbi:MAG: copper amine oxidase N-terminal domain-containing protein [Lachnospirales bacterium]
MKKKISLLLSCATMILGSLNVFGAVGLIVNNKTYVPVRGVFEELGFNVTYDKENATAIIIDSNFTIKIPKDKTYFFVNSNSISPDSPQKIINGNMYLPLRAIADSIGADISWNSETKIAHVSYKGKDSYISTKTTIPVKSATSSSSIIDNTATHPFYFFNGIELEENLDTRDGSEVRAKNRARTNLVTSTV